MDKITIYCVAGIHTTPVEMVKSEDGSFSRGISLPLPDQINVFMVGDRDHFPTNTAIDIQFYYEGVEFKLGSLSKATRNVVWERKKCDDTLPDLLKNSCEGLVRLEGLVRQVMSSVSENRPVTTATAASTNNNNKAKKRKASHVQEELENTPQPGKQAVLIGGQGDKHQLSKDSVWTLNTETRRWKQIQTEVEGPNPELRMGHTATYDPIVRCIYVYGGSKNLKWFRDVCTLDLNNWKWQLMKVNGKAPMRAYHTTTLYRHELWIFGGVFPLPNPQPDGCSNDIHIFSPVMETWYSPIVTGEKPLARSGHSATLLGDQLVVFGGWDAPFCYSDTFILDMTLLEWSQPKISGSPPKPRSWHASCALSGDRVLIHGGYDGDLALNDSHIFNLRDKSWTHIKVDPLPSPKTGHVALCLPFYHQNEAHDEVIVFGGGDNDGAFFTDLLSLSIPLQPLAETPAVVSINESTKNGS